MVNHYPVPINTNASLCGMCIDLSLCFSLSLSFKLIDPQKAERLETCSFWKAFLLAFTSWISCPAVSPTLASEKTLSIWRQSLSASGRWSLPLLPASVLLSNHCHGPVLQSSMDQTGKCTPLRVSVTFSTVPLFGLQLQKIPGSPQSIWTLDLRITPFIIHKKHLNVVKQNDVWATAQMFWFSISWAGSEGMRNGQENTLVLALKHDPGAS